MYTQNTKNKIRNDIFTYAIRLLTTERDQAPLLTLDYFHKSLEKFKKKWPNEINIDQNILNKWISFYFSRIGKKIPSELRVLYLAGPEPLNDVNVMLELGILEENIYGLECDINNFQSGLKQLQRAFSKIKFIKGNIRDFVKVYPEKFDIIYLDFCASFINGDKGKKTQDVLIQTLYSQSLTEIGILITNFGEPDFNKLDIKEDYSALLFNYFKSKQWVNDTSDYKNFLIEPYMYGDEEEADNGLRDFQMKISENIENFYGDFVSRFIYDLAGRIIPYWRILNYESLSQRYFMCNNESELNNATKVSLEQ
jgi:hypothetical protein